MRPWNRPHSWHSRWMRPSTNQRRFRQAHAIGGSIILIFGLALMTGGPIGALMGTFFVVMALLDFRNAWRGKQKTAEAKPREEKGDDTE